MTEVYVIPGCNPVLYMLP